MYTEYACSNIGGAIDVYYFYKFKTKQSHNNIIHLEQSLTGCELQFKSPFHTRALKGPFWVPNCSVAFKFYNLFLVEGQQFCFYPVQILSQNVVNSYLLQPCWHHLSKGPQLIVWKAL